MRRDDLKYIVCPYCKRDLEIKIFLEKCKEVYAGKLQCKCGRMWPIIKGIPRILPDELMEPLVLNVHRKFFEKYNSFDYSSIKKIKNGTIKVKEKTAKSFSFEWLSYPKIIEAFKTDFNRYFEPFLNETSFRDKVVLDAGCGMGKQSYFVAKYGAKLIAIDLSEAVEATYENVKMFDSLVIQCDIYNLPIRPDYIDIIYSIGVIHHLPNPQKGFLKLCSILPKNKEIFIWVYGKHKNLRALYLYNPLRSITTKLPKHVLYHLCFFPAFLVHHLNLLYIGINKFGLKNVAKIIPFNYYSIFPFSFKVNDSFDILATPLQKYYEKADIEDWFKSAGFKNYYLEYDVVQGIKGWGKK